MKRFFLITILGMLFFVASSQEIISSSGNTYSNDYKQVSWTIGESIIQTEYAGSIKLTQGFHQTNLVVTVVQELPEMNVNVVVYPNPTSDFVKVEVNDWREEKLNCIIYNQEGKVMVKYPLKSDLSSIPMSTYSPGTYFLKISDDNNTVKTFKIAVVR